MYNILSKLYDNEILISKYLYFDINKNKCRKELILQITYKLNNLLVNLTNECNIYIDNLLQSNDLMKRPKMSKYILYEEYIQFYIFNLKKTLKNIIEMHNEDNNVNNKSLKIKNLDKFYTNEHIVKECLDKFNTYTFNINDFDLVIEPSAGSGKFLLNINHDNKIGIDIEPEHESIIKKDFFEYYPNKDTYKNILTIGNPPFGRVCSLAIKFFNHASSFSNVIAFIIPRSFRKESIQNKLDINFKLVYDMDISNKSDTFYPPINVKCCFQIWVKNNNKRIIIKKSIKHNDWIFLNYNKDNILSSDFAIRAYGGECGKIIEENFSNSFFEK
jgi:hypothetical protein